MVIEVQGYHIVNPGSLDLINYSNGTHQGNVNFYSDGSTVGVNTGSFYWHTNGSTRLAGSYL